MYVKTTRRKRGDKSYEYLSLVESVREGGKMRHRTLFRLGEASALKESGQLDRIVAALRRHAEGNWIEVGELDAAEAPAVGGTSAVWTYWNLLLLHGHFGALGEERGSEALADAAFAMVANRLLAPSSKRRLVEWFGTDVVVPEGVSVPSLDQCYRALDAIAEAKEETEAHLYARLTDLTNLDLRLVCYDLTSAYFETLRAASVRFPSRAFGYSRDRRSDRPQIVIGLLVTGDGLPIAHHVFSGDTADVTTLPSVLADLSERFAVGRISVVADRGLISEGNLAALDEAGFDHVLATKLHRSPLATAAVAASAAESAEWVPVEAARSAACDLVIDGHRVIVVASAERLRRDDRRRVELVAKTEARLLALEDRVRQGELKDRAKIAAAAERILSQSGVRRVFDLEIADGRFLYHYDEEALDYEELLAGRYVITTSLDEKAASTAWVVNAYRSLQEVEARFRVLKDFLHLRPVFHWTESRVRGHVAVCVYASLIEALMRADLVAADVHDPDLSDQHLTPARALRELERIRRITLDAGESNVEVVTRRNGLQAKVLTTFGIDTKDWDRAHIE